MPEEVSVLDRRGVGVMNMLFHSANMLHRKKKPPGHLVRGLKCSIKPYAG